MTDAAGSQVSSHQRRRTGCVCWNTRTSQAKGVGDSACQERQSIASDCVCAAAHAMLCHQFRVLHPHAPVQFYSMRFDSGGKVGGILNKDARVFDALRQSMHQLLLP